MAAGAQLIAQRGYHAVSMAEIGRSAGITGSGIYRHFASKGAILVALFERVIDDLLSDVDAILESGAQPRDAVTRLIAGQVELVTDARAIAQVYHKEIATLPERDRRRLRRKQRRYVDHWVSVLRELQPQLEDAQARVIVHAAIGAMQSTLYHHADLDETRLRATLADAARQVLRL